MAKSVLNARSRKARRNGSALGSPASALIVSAAIALSSCDKVERASDLSPRQLDLLIEYQSDAASLDALLASMLRDVDSPDSPAAARLWTADSRLGPWLLSSGVYENRVSIVALKALGVSQVDVVVAFPVLTGTEVRAEEFRAFYSQLAAQAREAELELRVIVGPQYRGAMHLRGFPAGHQCDGDPTVTFAEHASAVVAVMKPDYLSVDINPLSLNAATGCADFADPELAAALALNVIENTDLPADTRLGISTAANEAEPWFAALLASYDDFYLDVSVHDFRSTEDNDLVRLNELARRFKDAGKDAAIGRYWLRKAENSASGVAYSPVDAARDTLSVWSGVDRKMHRLMNQSVGDLGLLYASAFQSDLLFAYLEPGEETIEGANPIGNIRLIQSPARRARIDMLKEIAANRGR